MEKNTVVPNTLPKTAWNSLSQAEKAEIIKVAVKNNITDLKTIRQKYNEFAEGGNMFDEDYYTTMYKVAKENNPTWNTMRREEGSSELSADAEYTSVNMAMGNVYDKGGIFSNLWNKLYGRVKSLLTSGTSQNQTTQGFTYRNRPAEKAITNPFIKDGTLVPLRIRPNTSSTKANSEILEDMMRSYIVNQEKANGSSNPKYDLPFIPEKSIIIDGSTTSTNILDSLAKYAGIHNRNPQLSEFPRKKRSSYGFPRKINRNEMLGLSTQETHNGAMPVYNYVDNDQDKKKALGVGYKEYNRALGNANYLTAFGYIPAENLVRNFQYNNANVNRATPPLLDAFRYYAQGDYNTGDQKHTQNVINKGIEAWKKPSVQKWWETSGKYWYNKGKGPK